MDKESIHVKYLVTNERDIEWGITVNSVGFQHINAGEVYPPSNHPTRYLFKADKGRMLEEYQFLYITRGKGWFKSSNMDKTQITEGNMFLLFPGEWHSYYPAPNTGWEEYWIGFKGINIDNRVASGFFLKEKPIFNVGIQEEIVQLYNQSIEIAREQKTGFQQMLAGIVNLIMGYAYTYDKQSSFEEKITSRQIGKAKIIILKNIYTSITPETIAEELNMSYSLFRRVFKQYTGFSPMQYILEIKMQKSKEILTNTELSSREVAFKMGFENPDYFCTLFKKRTGMTPMQFRKVTQYKQK